MRQLNSGHCLVISKCGYRKYMDNFL